MVMVCGQESPARPLTGQWIKNVQGRTATLAFAQDGKFQVDFAGDEEADVWGSYTVSDGRVTIKDEGGPYGSDSEATYEFKVSGSKITFTVVEDPLEGRVVIFSGEWSRAPGS